MVLQHLDITYYSNPACFSTFYCSVIHCLYSNLKFLIFSSKLRLIQNSWLVGMALHKPADNNRHGFVHTYRLTNGRGYHMPTDSNLHKRTWFTKEAGLHYDMLIHVHIVTLINLACDPIQVRPG